MTELPQPRPIDEVLAETDDTSFAIELSNLVFYREAALGFAHLSEAEQVAFMVDALEREVNNGGFAQFFSNSSGDHALQAPAALRAIGAPKMAGIVARALAVFGPDGPSPDRDVRHEQLDRLEGSGDETWSACDAEFCEYPEDLAALLRRFVTSRRHEFGPPLPPDPREFA